MDTLKRHKFRENYYPKICLFFTRSVHFLYKLIKPKSNNEDLKRREFILNVILLGSLMFSGTLTVITLIDVINLGTAYGGISPLILFLGFLLFLFLYFLSRNGFFSASAYILIAIYFIPITYTAYNWGVDIPIALLTYAFIIIVSGVLVSTRFAFIITLFISITIAVIGYFQINDIIHPNLYWTDEIFNTGDITAYITILAVIVTVCWLSNREIEKSLRRARRSEKALGKERDLLEIKVEKRTKELKKVQMEKMEQLYRSAEFGRLSSGLFHDLVNPLTAIFLNLGQVKDIDKNKLADTKTHLARAIATTKRMENFIIAVRKQIAKEEKNLLFSLTEEIMQAIQLLSYQAKKSNVEIVFYPTKNIRTFGVPIKFCQVVINLITNAIDAYGKIESFGKRRRVLVGLTIKDNIIHLTVQDWGKGIPPEHINKVFEPFFTTKDPSKGLGIGLPIIRNIIKKDFGGKIRIESRLGEKTTFIVEFPQRQNPPELMSS